MLSKKRSGFTLLELSIVLVIIGLVVGGVLAGNTLIKTAELRSITRDMDSYSTAMQAFRLKYGYLPGDFPEATNLWGEKADCSEFVSLQTFDGTSCNGNADGMINFWEVYGAWQHLSNASLVKGKYAGGLTLTGNIDDPSNEPAASPKLAIRNLYLDISYTIGTQHIADPWFADVYYHAYHIGNDLPPNITTPVEAYFVDSKLDDGRPAYGRVRYHTKFVNDSTLCITSITASDAAYNMQTGEQAVCGVVVVKAPI